MNEPNGMEWYRLIAGRNGWMAALAAGYMWNRYLP
jgi:hypothetical protein